MKTRVVLRNERVLNLSFRNGDCDDEYNIDVKSIDLLGIEA